MILRWWYSKHKIAIPKRRGYTCTRKSDTKNMEIEKKKKLARLGCFFFFLFKSRVCFPYFIDVCVFSVFPKETAFVGFLRFLPFKDVSLCARDVYLIWTPASHATDIPRVNGVDHTVYLPLYCCSSTTYTLLPSASFSVRWKLRFNTGTDDPNKLFF